MAVFADAVSGADQRGLLAGYFHLPPGTYTDDLNRAEESLDRLVESEFEVGLVYRGSSVLEERVRRWNGTRTERSDDRRRFAFRVAFR